MTMTTNFQLSRAVSFYGEHMVSNSHDTPTGSNVPVEGPNTPVNTYGVLCTSSTGDSDVEPAIDSAHTSASTSARFSKVFRTVVLCLVRYNSSRSRMYLTGGRRNRRLGIRVRTSRVTKWDGPAVPNDVI